MDLTGMREIKIVDGDHKNANSLYKRLYQHLLEMVSDLHDKSGMMFNYFKIFNIYRVFFFIEKNVIDVAS